MEHVTLQAAYVTRTLSLSGSKYKSTGVTTQKTNIHFSRKTRAHGVAVSIKTV
jgi:hypothetical protein